MWAPAPRGRSLAAGLVRLLLPALLLRPAAGAIAEVFTLNDVAVPASFAVQAHYVLHVSGSQHDLQVELADFYLLRTAGAAAPDPTGGNESGLYAALVPAAEASGDALFCMPVPGGGHSLEWSSGTPQSGALRLALSYGAASAATVTVSQPGSWLLIIANCGHHSDFHVSGMLTSWVGGGGDVSLPANPHGALTAIYAILALAWAVAVSRWGCPPSSSEAQDLLSALVFIDLAASLSALVGFVLRARLGGGSALRLAGMVGLTRCLFEVYAVTSLLRGAGVLPDASKAGRSRAADVTVLLVGLFAVPGAGFADSLATWQTTPQLIVAGGSFIYWGNVTLRTRRRCVHFGEKRLASVYLVLGCVVTALLLVVCAGAARNKATVERIAWENGALQVMHLVLVVDLMLAFGPVIHDGTLTSAASRAEGQTQGQEGETPAVDDDSPKVRPGPWGAAAWPCGAWLAWAVRGLRRGHADEEAGRDDLQMASEDSHGSRGCGSSEDEALPTGVGDEGLKPRQPIPGRKSVIF